LTSTQDLLRNWQTVPVRACDGDKLDIPQYLALVKLYVREGFRAPATSGGKKAKSPIVSTVISMTMFGFLFYMGRRYSGDLTTYLIFFYTAAFCIVAVGIIPEASTVYQRNIEVLQSKPVNERTNLAAAATIRLILVFRLLTPYSVIPFIAAHFSFDASWTRLAGSYVGLIAAGFSITTIWLSFLTWALRWIGVDRYRAVAKYLLLALLLLLMVPAYAPYLEEGWGAPVALSLSSLPWIKALPSAWFAALFAGNFDLISNLQRGGALILVGAAIGLSATRKSSMFYAHIFEKMAAVDERPTRRPVALKLMSMARQLPLVGKLIIPDQAFSIASLIIVSTSREDNSRLRTLSLRAFMFCIFVVYLFKPNPALLSGISFCAFSGIAEGMHLVTCSSFPGASWPLVAGPVDPRQMKRGIELAVLWGYVLLPAALGGAVLYWQLDAVVATALLLSYVLQARLLISLYLIMSPRIPLSQAVSPASGFMRMLIGFLYNFLNLVVYGILFLAISYVGIAGLLASGVILLVLAVMGYLFDQWASSRLAELEFAF